MFFHGEVSFNDEVVITNMRHKEAMQDAYESMMQVKASLEKGMPEDFYSIDLMSAYASLGKIPFEEPPILGLHGINAMLSILTVKITVSKPILAQARAASQPACPAPTTHTSTFSLMTVKQAEVCELLTDWADGCSKDSSLGEAVEKGSGKQQDAWSICTSSGFVEKEKGTTLSSPNCSCIFEKSKLLLGFQFGRSGGKRQWKEKDNRCKDIYWRGLRV